MAKNPETLYLVDGHALIYRCFYALPPLTNKNGLHTNSIYGFTKQILGFINQFKCKYLGIIFDPPGETFHHTESVDYKAQRISMPDELVEQIPWIYRTVDALGIRRKEMDGWEADDVIGTLSKHAQKLGLRVVIFSQDKDLFQLVNDNVSIYRFKQGVKTPEWITPERVALRYHGVSPDKMIDFLALMGDASDNVPGVPGVGEKTAAMLINEYGSCENLINSLNTIKRKNLKRNIEENLDKLELSKRLVTINCDIPIGFNIDEFTLKFPPNPEILPILEELEFNTLIKELNIDKKMNPPNAKDIIVYDLTDTDKNLGIFQQAITDAYRISCIIDRDDEKNGFLYTVINSKTFFKLNLSREDDKVSLVLDRIYSSGVHLIGWDIKSFLREFKLDTFPKNFFDIQLALYLLDPGSNLTTPKSLALYLGLDYVGIEKNPELLLDMIDESQVILQNKLAGFDMLSLYNNIEMPLEHILADMERMGICCDMRFIKKYHNELKEHIAKLEKEIHASRGHEFNILSSQQLQTVLFDEMGMPRGRRTKTGFSTDISVLEYLAAFYDFPAKVLDYRHLSKLLNTYINVLPTMVQADERIHTTWNQTVTATGRLSSSSPNLQNIPIRTDIGKRLRKFFIPAKNCVFLSADYSQIELRVLAHLSKDDNLREVFIEGKDIHTITAARIMNCPESNVKESMRRFAKTINFGIIYGLSAFGLSKTLGIPMGDAKRFIEDYHKQFPGIKRFQTRVLEFAHKEGYVYTLTGRRRVLNDINSEYARTRQSAERIAINTPVQGTAADLIKIAMVNINRKFVELKSEARIVAQVHDELLFEIPQKELETVKKIVHNEMEGALSLSVPLKVVSKHGASWYEAHA